MQRRKIFLPFFFLWQLADDKIPACKDVKLLFAGHIARHLLTFLLEGGSSLELVLAWLRNTSQSAHAPFRSSSLSMMGCTTLSPEAGDYQPLPSSQVESRGFQTCCSWWDATAWLFTSLNKQRETYFQNEEWREAAFWVSVSSTLPTDTHSHSWNRLWSTPWNKSKDVFFFALCHQLDGVGELVPLRKAAVFSQTSHEC